MHIKMIWGEACSTCRFLEPHLKSRAESKWYEFEKKDISEASQEEISWATTLPVIRINNEQISYDDVIAIMTK